jgi:enoyl-CoA hydratase
MSAAEGMVRLEQRGTIAAITFDRPRARNAMTWTMYEALDDALSRIEADTHLRVAVLRGASGHFVAGTDITQFAKFQTGDDGLSYERQLETVVAKLESMHVATIAAVEGFAAGAGLVIAAACDLRVAAPSAQFGVPIARTVGNCLSMINYARLVALLGASRTKAMLLTSDFMPADEARAIGFVTNVFQPETFDAELDSLAARVSNYAPITIQTTKEAIRRIISASSVNGDDLVRRTYASSDFHEGVAAYLEKRAAQWEGR